MFFLGSRNYYDRYRLTKAKGNFSEKLKPEQLIMRYASEIHQVFPLFHTLPHSYKINFCKRILLFLKQYAFHPRQNVFLTNAHKVKIAASYVKLTLGYKEFLVNSFHDIIVYPTAQYFEEFSEIHVGHFHPKMKTIMLALDEFEKGINTTNDGKDLALHEFSHALCFEMLKPNALHPDASHFKQCFKKIVQWMENPSHLLKVKNDGLIRDYGFSNKLELISVLVEVFFECSIPMKSKYPELYYYVGKMLHHPSVKS